MENTQIFASIFSRATKARLSENVITVGHVGIEVNLNGWQVANNDFPQDGEPAEFRTEAEARNSKLFNRLVQRYGQDRVRIFIQHNVT